MAITALPTPPTRTDPSSFATRGDAFLAALPAFATEANTLASDVNTQASNAASAATSASSNAAACSAAVTAVNAAINMSVAVVSGTSQAAASGNIYVLQNAAATTVTLPANPNPGDVVGIKSANGRFDNVVARNGKQIEGKSEDVTIDVKGIAIKLQYIDSTSQWRIL